MAHPTFAEEALRALATPDAEARRLFVRSLEREPFEAACAVLPTVLGDDDWRVRKEAIHLAHAVADRGDVVSVLIEALTGPADEVSLRNAALEALSGLGAAAVDAVERVLERSEPPLDADRRKLVIEVLGGTRLQRALPVLTRALDDPDPNVRACAAEAIGLVGGDDAIQPLLSLLAHDDRLMRLTALEGLNGLGVVLPFARLAPFLGDRILRHAAVAALSRAEDADADTGAALVDALSDPSRQVAETAVHALGTWIKSAPPRARSARKALETLSPRGRERMLFGAADADSALRLASLPTVALFGDHSAVDAMLRALIDDDLADEAETAIVDVAAASGALTANEGVGLASLLEAAHRGDPQTRAAVIRLLPRLLDHSPDAAEALREGLRDPHPDVFVAAAAAFAAALAGPGQRGGRRGILPDAGDVHALMRAAATRSAKDGGFPPTRQDGRDARDPRVEAVALQTLRTLARLAPDAVRPHLAHVDPSDDEAPVVCALLSVAGGPEHVAWLSRAVSAVAARTRRAAVEALAHIGGTSAASAVTFAIADEVPEVALAAIRALGRARDASSGSDPAPGVPPLLRLLDSSEDPALVMAAVRALGQTGSPRAADAIRPLIDSASVPLSCSALEALAELAVDDLAEIAAHALDHPSAVVVRAALDVLDGIVEPDLDSLLPPVRRSLSHASWDVRRRAVEILARLDREGARPLLFAHAAGESEPAVREALDVALDRAPLSVGGPLSLRSPISRNRRWRGEKGDAD